jgi:class 3 adenylate cyclase
MALLPAASLQWLPDDLRTALRNPNPSNTAVAAACAHLRGLRAHLLPAVPPSAIRHITQATAPLGIIRELGSLVCADFSGLTNLLRRLGSEGRAGSEEASWIITHLFDLLNTHVSHWGGGVQQFGGDALIAFFSNSSRRSRRLLPVGLAADLIPSAFVSWCILGACSSLRLVITDAVCS